MIIKSHARIGYWSNPVTMLGIRQSNLFSEKLLWDKVFVQGNNCSENWENCLCQITSWQNWWIR